jgi:hypothetical protein
MIACGPPPILGRCLGSVFLEVGSNVFDGAPASVVSIADDDHVDTYQCLAVLGSPLRSSAGLPCPLCPGGGHYARSLECEDVLFPFREVDDVAAGFRFQELREVEQDPLNPVQGPFLATASQGDVLPERLGPEPLLDIERRASRIGVRVLSDDRAAMVGLARFVE